MAPTNTIDCPIVSATTEVKSGLNVKTLSKIISAKPIAINQYPSEENLSGSNGATADGF
jgi:hypothetical protein